MNTDEILPLVKQAEQLAREIAKPIAIVRRDGGLMLIRLGEIDPAVDYLIEIIRPVK